MRRSDRPALLGRRVGGGGRGAWRIWQIFTGQIQNVVYRAAQEYATAVVYGRGEDGP